MHAACRYTRLCETGQIDQCETENVRRVDFEVDGLSVDALVTSCYPGRLILNLSLDLAKVIELAARNVTELAPLILTGYTGGSVWYIELIAFRLVLSLAWHIDELQNERSSGDDAASTRQEIPSDNVLQHRRLS